MKEIDEDRKKSKIAAEDSPAFCLRPRRSTPCKSTRDTNHLPGGCSLLVGKSSSRRLSTLMIVKNSLFSVENNNRISKLSRLLATKPRRDTLRRSAAESVICNHSIGPFMESITIDELQPNKVYDKNYISLIIDHVIADEELTMVSTSLYDYKSNNTLQNSSNTSIENERKIRCKKIMTDEEVIVELYGEYAKCEVQLGQVIHIAKFKTSNLKQQTCAETSKKNNYNHENTNEIYHTTEDNLINQDINGAITSSLMRKNYKTPFSIIVSATGSSTFIPLISVANSIDEPEDPYVELVPVDHKLN